MNLPLNIDVQQILLHLFNFIILTGGLYILLYSPVKKFMEKRDASYAQMYADAEEKTASAQQLHQQCELRMQKLDSEINAKTAEAISRAEEESSQIIHNAQVRAEEIVAGAQHAAEQEKKRILAETQKEIAELAVAATEKILLENTASAAFDQFLDAAERRDLYA